MAVTAADERLHPVEDPSPLWSDSLYFNVWDPASSLFLLTRIAILPNQPGATAGVLAWIDGRVFGGYGHNLDEVPKADWDDMVVGGLRCREAKPLQSWEITLDDAPSAMNLRWDGFTSVVHYNDNAQPLPRAVAWGHYEQTCNVTGSLTLGGRDVEVAGVGQRDHSWGYRDWAGLREWHWVTGFVGEPGAWRSFNLFDVVQPDGTRTVSGYVHDGGDDHLIVAAERDTTESSARSPESFAITLTVDGGRSFTFRGDNPAMEVPVRPHAGGTIVHERPMRMTSDDGLQGMGIYELLENTSGA